MLRDLFTRQNSVVYALVIQGLIKGVEVSEIGNYLKGLAKNAEIRAIVGSFDNFLTPSYGQVALHKNVPAGG